MKDIKRLVNQFRDAIDIAKGKGEFLKDIRFRRVPSGCCDDASDLLAQFLLENDIKTYNVSGSYRYDSDENTQSHEWLVADNQTIIDITGDQFRYDSVFSNYNKPVYVGAEDNFHRLFEDRRVHENMGLDSLGSMSQPRLNELYRKITKYV